MTNEELVILIQKEVDVKENMGILYQQNEKIIRRWAYPHCNNNKENLEDLMQEAYFGLIAAVKGFNPRKEFKFLTYAQWKILRKIIRYSQNNRHIKRIPIYMLNLMSQYYKFKTDHYNENGQIPNDEELMDFLKINKKQFKKLEKQISEVKCVSLETPIFEDKTIAEMLIDDLELESDIINKLTYSQLSTDLWEEVDKLEEVQKHIIIQRYKNQNKLEQIAIERNLSGQRVEQIEKKALYILSKKKRLQYMAKFYGYDCRVSFKYGLQRFKDTMTSSTEMIAIKNMEIQEDLLKINNLIFNIVNL